MAGMNIKLRDELHRALKEALSMDSVRLLDPQGREVGRWLLGGSPLDATASPGFLERCENLDTNDIRVDKVRDRFAKSLEKIRSAARDGRMNPSVLGWCLSTLDEPGRGDTFEATCREMRSMRLALEDLGRAAQAEFLEPGEHAAGKGVEFRPVELARLMTRLGVEPPPPPEDFIQEKTLEAHLRDTACVILQGPPGTGKTYAAECLIDYLAGNSGPKRQELQYTQLLARHGGDLEAVLADPELAEFPVVWELVQMHPGYAYDDFVRGQVTAEGEQLRFVSKDRIMVELARVAQARQGKPTLLVMDEINRCNLASVLGELILVLERSKRSQQHKVRLQYPGPGGDRQRDLIWLPENLWLLGTMNTADRSIALVDYAIRRRFRFLDLLPDRNAIQGYYTTRNMEEQGERALALFDKVSPGQESSAKPIVLSPNLQVGHSYFMVDQGERWDERLAHKLLYEVVPLLREYHAEHKLREGVTTLAITDALEIPLDRAAPVAGHATDLLHWLKA